LPDYSAAGIRGASVLHHHEAAATCIRQAFSVVEQMHTQSVAVLSSLARRALAQPLMYRTSRIDMHHLSRR
jgi:hypothetical protein